MHAIILLLLLASINDCSGYRILGFFPFASTSHHNVFRPILHELAKRGHQVVYVTPIPSSVSHPNLDVRSMHDFKQKFLGKLDLMSLSDVPAYKYTQIISKAMIALAENFYGDQVTREIIHGSDSFDAVLMESHFAQEPVSALLHKFGCPAVEISTLGDSAWINELSGLPNHHAYQIDFKSPYTDDMSILERAHNFYINWATVLLSYYYLWDMQILMDKYFNYTGWETRPPINKLISNRSMILINRHVAMDYPYPKAPHVQDIGGVNVVPNKTLPKDVQTFMDEAKEGVIYFSMGSNLNTSDIMKGEIGKAFFAVLSKLPQKVLMKWENEKGIQIPPNIKTLKWFPQGDILAHKNCLLFISHGGFLSLSESVYHGVPLLGIAFFGDQPKNMKQVEWAGYGLQLSRKNISLDSVSWAIKELLNNPRYKEEAMKRSRMVREDDTPAVVRAANWVEYAIKYPNALTPRSAYLSFFELHMLDLGIAFLILLVTLYFTICALCAFRWGTKSSKKVKTS